MDIDKIAIEVAKEMGYTDYRVAKFKDFARRLLARMASEQKPAAWMWTDKRFPDSILLEFNEPNIPSSNINSLHPLYTHPLPTIPPGWKLVPEEPTEKMAAEGRAAMFCEHDNRQDAVFCYKAMLDAAQTPREMK